MADDFNFEVLLRFATQGAKGSADDLRKVADAVDQLNREGKLSERQLESLTRGINRAGSAAGSSRSSTDALAAAQEKLNTALSSQNFERNVSGLSGVESAQARLAKATQERATAQQAYDRAAKSGDPAAQLESTRNLTSAVNAQTAAEKGLASAQADRAQESERLRYANYDLARSMLAISAGVTAAGVGIVAAAGSYESAFTAVERTSGVTGDAVGELRGELVGLTREIPQTFSEIANIGARGAQLGVASTELAEFTEVVAQFVATSDTVSLDQAVEAFGRISNLTGERDFNKLGSAITLVGVNAAATEAQIVKTTQELAPFAAAVGVSTADVIGLAAAVASLGQPPERARSAFLTLQRVVDGAVTGMNDKLGVFAQLLGMTESQVAALWQQDPGEFIKSFVNALGSVDNLTVAFDQLGINERRAVQVFQALAADASRSGAELSVLERALNDSNQGFNEGTELQRQYALILDDLTSKWQIFLNAIMEAAAATGNTLVPTVKTLLDLFTSLVQQFADFAASDAGSAFIRIAAALGTVVAAYTLLRGSIALATAAVGGFATVSRVLGGAGIAAGLSGLVTAFRGVTSSSTTATGSLITFRGALLALGRATIVIGLIQLLGEALFNTGQVAVNVGDFFIWVARNINGLGRVVIGAINAILSAASPLLSLLGSVGVALDPDGIGAAFGQLGNTIKSWGEEQVSAQNATDGLSGSLGVLDDSAEDAAGGIGNLGGATNDAAAEIRTLTDYANDLASVWERAFEIRFSGQQTLDTITSSIQAIRDAAEESARTIRGLSAEIQGLQNDISAQEYFLGVAVEYKDFARVEAIQANLAKLQDDLANKTDDLNKAQADNSKELTGNSKAAIANRKTITDLVSQYQAHIRALASSGVSQDELARGTEELRQDFIAQATQLGYSRAELFQYEQAFYDVTTAINGVPRNITVTANVDPAIQALNEFEARGRSAAAGVGQAIRDALGGAGGIDTQTADDAARRAGRRAALLAEIAILTAQATIAGIAGNPGAALGYQGAILARRIRLDTGSYADGGFTGRGGRLEPAGIVHRGEYVVPKHMVNQRTGLPHADALGRLQRGASGRSGYAGGGFVGGGGSAFNGVISGYSPMAMQQMMAAFQQYINLDGKRLTQTTSRGYQNSTALGNA